MPFGNSGQGMAQKQGTPPLNVFDALAPNGRFATTGQPSFSTILPSSYMFDVHAYQSLNINVLYLLGSASIGTPQTERITLDWYTNGGASGGALIPGILLATDTYYVTDDNLGAKSNYEGLRVLTPVKGYYLRVSISAVGNTNQIQGTIVGQYNTLAGATSYNDSAYFGVSGGTTSNTTNGSSSMFDKFAAFSLAKAAGIANIIDYPPCKSGKCHVHMVVQNVTAAQATFEILDLISGFRIAAENFVVAAPSVEVDFDIILPTKPISLTLAPSSSGWTVGQVELSYE